MIVSIDYETKSATDIKLGLERYSRDPECDVLTLSYRFPGADILRWNPSMESPPVQLLEHVRQGGLIRGWNVMFEWTIWNNVCTSKYNWPSLKLEQLRDTMAEAAAMNLPQALGRCAEVLGLPSDQQKSKRGRYLIQRLCVPHTPTKSRPGKWVEDVELFAELCDYCDQDVVTEEAVGRKLRRLSDFEQKVWLLTQRINARGIPVAVDEIRNIVDIVEAEKERLNRELRQITGRAVLKASARVPLRAWVNKVQGEDIELADDVDFDEERPGHEELIADTKGETVERVLQRTDLKPEVRRALEILSQVCQTSTAKFAKILKIAGDDGRVRGMHTYHGAGTGRWASRGGLNTQNFARPTMSDADIAVAHEILGKHDHATALMMFGDRLMDAAVSCLRGVIKAPDGYEFLDADYSSVENRVAAWIAGQQDKLDMFAQGLDEYKTFASKRLFNCAYEDVTSKQRQYTKPVILGGIFGLGAAGLLGYAEGYGVKMNLDEAKTAIDLLRQDYKKVRDCWYACGNAMVDAIRNPGTWFEVGTKLQFCVYNNFLWLKLPSGRLISWARPSLKLELMPWKRTVWVLNDAGERVQIEEDVYQDVVYVESIETTTRQWCRHKLIGSSAFQSAVQGTARDILAYALVEHVEPAGYETVMLVHDEDMALVPKGWGDDEEFGRLLCTPAEWYADLPLDFSVWRGSRYRK